MFVCLCSMCRMSVGTDREREGEIERYLQTCVYKHAVLLQTLISALNHLCLHKNTV